MKKHKIIVEKKGKMKGFIIDYEKKNCFIGICFAYYNFFLIFKYNLCKKSTL